MKVRLGFVSNSSTSSYLVLATMEAHEAILAAMGEDGKTLAEISHAFEKKKVMGQDT
jgi:hypothetical protein